MKRKSIPKVWMLVILFYTGIVLFGFGELVSRLWLGFLANDAQVMRFERLDNVNIGKLRFSSHPDLNYYPTPSFINGGCSHNSRGYRSAEFAIEKPSGTYRIVLLGGSSTYSFEVKDNASTYPVLLEKILQDRYNHQDIEVINAGVIGYTTWETLANLRFRVLDLDPDLIVISHGIDDVRSRLGKQYRSDNSGFIRSWQMPEDPWWNYSYLIRIISRTFHFTDSNSNVWKWILNEEWDEEAVRATDPQSVRNNVALLQKNLPIYFEQNVENMISLAKDREIDVMLTTSAISTEAKFPNSEYVHSEYIKTGLNEHNTVTKSLATKYDLHVIDLNQSMPQNDLYWADNLSVNKAGSQIKAELYAKSIDQLLSLE